MVLIIHTHTTKLVLGIVSWYLPASLTYSSITHVGSLQLCELKTNLQNMVAFYVFGNPFVPPIFMSFQCWEWGGKPAGRYVSLGVPPQPRQAGNQACMPAAQSCLVCASPATVAHPAPPSRGLSRQENWSGEPLPSPVLLSKFILIYCSIQN